MISVSAASDFVCAHPSKLKEPPRGALPYCLDFLRARAIYVCDVDTHKVQSAPFYYLCLRRNARRVLSVPIEYGPVTNTSGPRDPYFLFSPGRCGSTLLSRIFYEAGIVSVSEVDFYTQMTTAFWSHEINPLRGPFQRAMWNLTSDLSAALGGIPVIKLRAESCRAPQVFLRSPAARTLVMFRVFEDWARSTTRVFGAGAGKSVRKYFSALKCYSVLRKSCACHVVRYEELVNSPAKACAELARFLGVPIPQEAVACALERDSQRGTPLETGRHAAGWEGRFDAAMRLWRSPRLVSARDRLGIPNLWD